MKKNDFFLLTANNLYTCDISTLPSLFIQRSTISQYFNKF